MQVSAVFPYKLRPFESMDRRSKWIWIVGMRGFATMILAVMIMAAEFSLSLLGRDLSSGRMQLRGIVKQTGERFGERPAFAELRAALERLERLLAAVKADAAA